MRLDPEPAGRQENVQPRGEEVVDAEAAEHGEHRDKPPATLAQGEHEGGVEHQHGEAEADELGGGARPSHGIGKAGSGSSGQVWELRGNLLHGVGGVATRQNSWRIPPKAA